MSDVLLIGNGINRAFDSVSWSNLIDRIKHKNNTDLADIDLSKIPLPMQVVLASDDNVCEAVKLFHEDLDKVNTEDQNQLINKLLRLPVDELITTNYSFEFEQTCLEKPSIYNYRKLRKHSKDIKNKDVLFNLYRYYAVDDNKKIWHIHGDITQPSTIIIGTYYYGKLVREIQNYVSDFMRRYKSVVSKGEIYKKLSWVDSFLTENIHIVGFGFDFNETDLWWLIGCKKRNFPDTKIYYYTPESDISKEKEMMLMVFGVKVIKDISFEGSYPEFYERVVDRVSTTINRKDEDNEKD